MCNLLITKHSLCGCTTTLQTSYCDIQRNTPHVCLSTTSITSTISSTSLIPCKCTGGQTTHRTVNHQCGCHSWEDLYKREDKITRVKEKERMYRQMEKLERKREREMREYREMKREEMGDSGTGGMGSPDTEDENGGNGRGNGRKVAVEDAESDGVVGMGNGREMSVESMEN